MADDDSDGQLAILLIVPAFWLILLRVQLSFPLGLHRSSQAKLTFGFSDDRRETRYHSSHWPDILQLHRHVLFCRRGQFSSKMECWTLYACLFPHRSLITELVDVLLNCSGSLGVRPLRCNFRDRPPCIHAPRSSRIRKI